MLRADGILELIGSDHIHGNVNRAIEAQLADGETSGPPPGGDAAGASVMKWEIPILAAALLAVAGVSRRLTDTPFTPAMAFVLIGLLVGPLVLDEVTVSPASETVRTLAEATLAVVLFADASRIKLRVLRQEYAVPLRLLGIGLPLTIVIGALLAAAMFAHLNAGEAVVLAVLLAPTDAALGQAVVTEPRLPSRIRQGLNVESGLNDGICVPLLLIALAAADVEAKTTTSHHAVSIVAEEIGYGILGGVAAGLAAAAVVAIGHRRDLISGSWLQVIPIAGAALAYGFAAALGGSGFIAAFLAGAIFGGLVPEESEEASRLNEELGALLGGVTFLIFGAVLLGADAEARELADRALRGAEPDRRPHAAGRHRDARQRRQVADGRVPRLVRPARPGIDRVRGDHRPAGAPGRRRHDPARHVPDHRPVRVRPRNHGRAAGQALRPLVRDAPAAPQAADGKRPRATPSRPLETAARGRARIIDSSVKNRQSQRVGYVLRSRRARLLTVAELEEFMGRDLVRMGV